MKLSKLLVHIALVFIGFNYSVYSQKIDRDYFRSPVKPGGRNYLSGNFAELRPNHFHTGLDYKFGGVEGEPIYAAADGWVYRIKVSSFGYGNVIYLKHPNGKITLYGHLRNFNKTISDYMQKKMYEAEVNELEVYPEPRELPVKIGEQIANGGNTGSSGGPHLHFEIRDSLDRAMDPLLFGFPEIIDNTAPIPQSIAIVPLDVNSRVNGKYQRLQITPVASGSNFRLPNTIYISGRVAIEVQSYDRLDGASNRNGFPNFELFQEDSLLFQLTVDKVDFNLSRQFLLHTYQNRYTKLYKQRSLKFDFISPDSLNTGHLSLDAEEKKDYTLKLSDAYKNLREIKFTLQGKELENQVNAGNTPSKANLSFHQNILKITAPISSNGGLAKFFIAENTYEMLPAYMDSQSRTYLWDMNFGIPDQVDICSEVLTVGVNAKIPVNRELLIAEENYSITFAENSLLEDLFLRVESNGTVENSKLEINDDNEYLWKPVSVKWNISKPDQNAEKVHIYQQYSNGRKSFVGGTWEEGSISFKTGNFGTFVLAEDIDKPSIRVIRANSSEIRFSIKDDLSGINSFEARINGKWVLMRYEHKQAVIWSEKMNEKPFKGTVVLKVTDQAGNIAEWTGTIS